MHTTHILLQVKSYIRILWYGVDWLSSSTIGYNTTSRYVYVKWWFPRMVGRVFLQTLESRYKFISVFITRVELEGDVECGGAPLTLGQ